VAEHGKPGPGPASRPPENTAVSHLLITVAAVFHGAPRPDDAAIADVLGELLRILHDRQDLSRNVFPPPGYIKPLSGPLARLEAALAPVVRRYRDSANAAISPNALPAGLEDETPGAGVNPHAPRSSAQDVIDLDQAATLLGVGRERARQLVREHKLTIWSKLTGRHELQVYRHEVIALREQRSGDGGIGSRERRPDPGREAGGGPAGGDRAA
jgi:hypothetical protein